MIETTHVRIPKSVKEQLVNLRQEGESIGDTIKRLILYYESAFHEPGAVNGKLPQIEISGKYKTLEGRIIALETKSGTDNEYIDVFHERVKSLERYVEKEFEAINTVASVIENTIDSEIIPNEISDQVRKLTRIVADVTVEMNNMRRFVSTPIKKNILTSDAAIPLEPDYRAVIPEVIQKAKPKPAKSVTKTIPKTHDIHYRGNERITITEDMRMSLISQIDKLKEKYGSGAVTRIANESGITNSQITKLYNKKIKSLTRKQIDALLNL